MSSKYDDGPEGARELLERLTRKLVYEVLQDQLEVKFLEQMDIELGCQEGIYADALKVKDGHELQQQCYRRIPV